MILVFLSLSFLVFFIIFDFLCMFFVIKIIVLGIFLWFLVCLKILRCVFCKVFIGIGLELECLKILELIKFKIVYIKLRRMFIKIFLKVMYIFLIWNLFKDVMWKVKYEMSCINGKLNYILLYIKNLYVYLYCILIYLILDIVDIMVFFCEFLWRLRCIRVLLVNCISFIWKLFLWKVIFCISCLINFFIFLSFFWLICWDVFMINIMFLVEGYFNKKNGFIFN